MAKSQVLVSRFATSVLLLLLFVTAEAGFLGGLAKVNPSKLAAPREVAKAAEKAAKTSAADIAETVKAKANPADIADTIKEVLNGSSSVEDAAEDVKGTAGKSMADALGKLSQEAPGDAGSAPDADAGASMQSPKEKVSQAMTAASHALKRGAEAVKEVSTADTHDVVKRVGGEELLEEGKVLKEKIEQAKPEEVAAVIRQAAKKGAKVVNSTGLSFGELLQQKVPQVASFLNQTGHVIADHLSDGVEKVTGRRPSLEDVQGWGASWLLAGVLVLALMGVAGCHAVRLMGRSESRGPGLLGGGAGTQDSARTPSIQLPASESTSFMNF